MDGFVDEKRLIVSFPVTGPNYPYGAIANKRCSWNDSLEYQKLRNCSNRMVRSLFRKKKYSTFVSRKSQKVGLIPKRISPAIVQRPRLPPFLLVQKRSLAMICTSCKNKRPIPTLRPNPRRESSQTLLGECFLLVLPPPWGSSLGSDTSKQNRVCLQPDRFCWNSASADAFIHVFLRVFQTIQSQA